MLEINDTVVERLANPMIANRDMLGTRMESCVARELDCGFVVAMEDNWIVEYARGV